jgi:hypothetical protein
VSNGDHGRDAMREGAYVTGRPRMASVIIGA